MVVHEVASDSQFPEQLNAGGTKLVVIDFSAKWWGGYSGLYLGFRLPGVCIIKLIMAVIN